MVVMRIRDATGLTVAVACGALAACADASGIVLTVEPAADRPDAVVEADTLVVYVGYGDVVESPLGQNDVHLHVDDGAARRLELDAPFDAPIEVLLEGPESGQPFYVAVRAELDGQVVGEGGVDDALMLVDGRVTTAVAPVGGPIARTMPNCPGFRRNDGPRHYIVGADRDDDCDADGAPAIEGGGPDCNDFDATFHPGADDQVCDDFDHSCGENTSITQSPCLVESSGDCLIGMQTCRDGEGGTSECIGDPANVVPDQVCEVCEGAMNQSDLEECLPQVDIAYTLVCALKRVDHDFCLSQVQEENNPFDPDVWWLDWAPQGPGTMHWLDLPRVRQYDFLWAVGDQLEGWAQSYPGAPAVKLVEEPTVSFHEFVKYIGAVNNVGEPEMWMVHFSVEEAPEKTCPINEEIDCFVSPKLPGVAPGQR
jgi:hypothetical protein